MRESFKEIYIKKTRFGGFSIRVRNDKYVVKLRTYDKYHKARKCLKEIIEYNRNVNAGQITVTFDITQILEYL